MPEWRPRTLTQRTTTLVLNKKKEYDRKHPPVDLNDPLPEVLRECIKDGYCPWCGRGGWKSLSVHTAHAHGIYANDIRDLAELFKHNPTCTPELSYRCKIRTEQQLLEGTRKPPINSVKGRKHQFNKAGRKYQDEIRTAILLANTSDDQRRVANKINAEKSRKPHPCPVCGKTVRVSIKRRVTCSPECRKIIRQRTVLISHANRILKVPKAERAIIKSRFLSGESSRALAREYGISSSYVRLIGKNINIDCHLKFAKQGKLC